MFFAPFLSFAPQFSFLHVSRVAVANRHILDRFNRDAGRYPIASDGLRVFAVKHLDIKGWNGPYRTKPTLDLWTHSYLYIAKSEGKGFEFVCYGSNGREGGSGPANLEVDG